MKFKFVINLNTAKALGIAPRPATDACATKTWSVDFVEFRIEICFCFCACRQSKEGA